MKQKIASSLSWLLFSVSVTTLPVYAAEDSEVGHSMLSLEEGFDLCESTSSNSGWTTPFEVLDLASTPSVGQESYVSYEGEKDEGGLPHGQGRSEYHDGGFYQGEWQHGKKHGSGHVKTGTGMTFTGTWEDDLLHGRIVWTDSVKDTKPAMRLSYEGDFDHGNWPLQTTVLFPHGIRYCGELGDGGLTGRGRLDHPGGWFYEGMWRHSKRHGQGKVVRADGASWEGEWREGKRHGHGIDCAADGRTEGEWLDDELDSSAPHSVSIPELPGLEMYFDGTSMVLRSLPKQ